MQRMNVHICAPAGSCRRYLEGLGVPSAAAFLDRVRFWLRGEFSVTGDPRLLETDEDDRRGGRRDDDARAEDLMQAFADDATRAIVALRGGAWLTRVLPRIDFSLLDRRTTPVAVFGFSEITSLVNLVACRRFGRGVLDLGPAFIHYGLKRFDARYAGTDATPDGAELEAQTARYFADVCAMLTGVGSSRPLPIRVLEGTVPPGPRVRFVGGNLAVLAATLARRDYEEQIFGDAQDGDAGATARWLVLEDVNEAPYRIDRLLAHLTLAVVWRRVDGILLGNFHHGAEDLLDAVLSLLPHHLGADRRLPVVGCDRIGHVWPMSPLPVNFPIRVDLDCSGRGALTVNWGDFASC
ncbi:MAG: peptidase S66 [Phycisphaerae bacterium]